MKAQAFALSASCLDALTRKGYKVEVQDKALYQSSPPKCLGAADLVVGLYTGEVDFRRLQAEQKRCGVKLAPPAAPRVKAPKSTDKAQTRAPRGLHVVYDHNE